MAITLATVDAAITAIQDEGQSIMVDGSMYTAANIGSLVTLRKQLQDETLRTSGNRPLFRRFKLSGMGYS